MNLDEITHMNKYESQFVHHEIFNNNCYLKNGIKIHEEGVVFDVGANIGLFALYVKSHSPKAQIFSFEPAAKTFEVLKTNLKNFSGIHLFQMGLGDHDHEAPFTFYPGYSVISGLKGNKDLDQAVIMQGEMMSNQLSFNEVKDYVSERFSRVEISLVMIRSLSSIIKEHNIPQIDLLKIDVEKFEEEVFNGIEIQDWKKINQIVMEVHGLELAKFLQARLIDLGFLVDVEGDGLLEAAGIFTLFGKNSHA